MHKFEHRTMDYCEKCLKRAKCIMLKVSNAYENTFTLLPTSDFHLAELMTQKSLMR